MINEICIKYFLVLGLSLIVEYIFDIYDFILYHKYVSPTLTKLGLIDFSKNCAIIDIEYGKVSRTAREVMARLKYPAPVM